MPTYVSHKVTRSVLYVHLGMAQERSTVVVITAVWFSVVDMAKNSYGFSYTYL